MSSSARDRPRATRSVALAESALHRSPAAFDRRAATADVPADLMRGTPPAGEEASPRTRAGFGSGIHAGLDVVPEAANTGKAAFRRADASVSLILRSVFRARFFAHDQADCVVPVAAGTELGTGRRVACHPGEEADFLATILLHDGATPVRSTAGSEGNAGIGLAHRTIPGVLPLRGRALRLRGQSTGTAVAACSHRGTVGAALVDSEELSTFRETPPFGEQLAPRRRETAGSMRRAFHVSFTPEPQRPESFDRPIDVIVSELSTERSGLQFEQRRRLRELPDCEPHDFDGSSAGFGVPGEVDRGARSGPGGGLLHDVSVGIEVDDFEKRRIVLNSEGQLSQPRSLTQREGRESVNDRDIARRRRDLRRDLVACRFARVAEEVVTWGILLFPWVVEHQSTVEERCRIAGRGPRAQEHRPEDRQKRAGNRAAYVEAHGGMLSFPQGVIGRRPSECGRGSSRNKCSYRRRFRARRASRDFQPPASGLSKLSLPLNQARPPVDRCGTGGPALRCAARPRAP